ncbi:MAG: hypothetical protein ACOCUT_01665 [bacterium]
MEIGKSCYSEFLSKNGIFERTEDIVVVDIVEAENEEDALEKVRGAEEHSWKKFDDLIVKRVV